MLLSYPLYHKYWSLSYRYILYITVLDGLPYWYIPYIKNTGSRHSGTSSFSQELVPVLPVLPTGPCPISPVLVPVLQVHPLYHSTGPCPTGTSPVSQTLVSVLPVHPVYHSTCPVLPVHSLYYSTGPCHTGTFPI